MPEDMATEELHAEYARCAEWMEDHPDDLATGEWMLDLRYEYHFRTGANIAA